VCLSRSGGYCEWARRPAVRSAQPQLVNDGADELYVNFGADGLWSWNAGSWLQEAASYPWDMIPANIDGDAAAEIVVDFGPGIGLYNLDGSVWDLMTMAHAEFLLAADLNGDHIDEIIGDFGPLGLWFWLGGTWAQISGADPDSK
jgi:hypothetical protein